MAKAFQGNAIISGDISGNCVVEKEGFNPLQTFQTAGAQNRVKGKIMCLTEVYGSTTGGLFLQFTAGDGNAPVALLFSRKIDSLAAAGVIMSKIWDNIDIITIDGLGEEFINHVQENDRIEVFSDGRVIVG